MLLPEGLLELWALLSAAPQKCRTRKAKVKAGQEKSSVGKEIGLVYGSYLILNTIIGPGIFTSPKGVLQGAGSVGMSLVIWGVCGVFSTMAALCFAELRESVKRDGVEYAYITEAFGPLAGFVYCWMRIAAAEPVGTAVFAVVLADYTADTVYDDCAPPLLLRKSIAILAVVSLALVNVFSQQLADRLQVLATVGKTVACGVIIVFGLKHLAQGETGVLRTGFEGTASGPTSITFAIYNGLWAYGGWSNVNHVTSGLRKPPRNVPRLVKTVIPLVMVIYGLVVTSYFTMMSRAEMLASQAIGVTWAERTFEKMRGGLVAIIPIGVGLTAMGSLNATFLSAGRLSGVAVKDGNMPEVTSWIHVRSKTPIVTVYTRLLIAIIMIAVAEVAELVRFFIFSVWLFHGMSILALLLLRFKNKDKVRPYKVNLVLPVMVVGVIAFLLIGPFLEAPKPEFISSLVLIGLSLLCYLPCRWLQSRVSVPDRFIVWIQLFFRIAPKRDSRRKSIMRKLSAIALARNSILIPAGASPTTIRRIQESPALRRRLSRASVLLDVAANPALFSTVTEADPRRSRSHSLAAWMEAGDRGPLSQLRHRPSRHVASFGAADRSREDFPQHSAEKLSKVLNLKLDKGCDTEPNMKLDKGCDTEPDINHSYNNNISNVHRVSFSVDPSTTPPAFSTDGAPAIRTLHLPPGVRGGSGLCRTDEVVGENNVLASPGTFRHPLAVMSANSESHFVTSDALPPHSSALSYCSIPSPIMEESYLSSSPSVSGNQLAFSGNQSPGGLRSTLSGNESPGDFRPAFSGNQSPGGHRSAFSRIDHGRNHISYNDSKDPSSDDEGSFKVANFVNSVPRHRKVPSRRYSLNIEASSRPQAVPGVASSRRYSLSHDLQPPPGVPRYFQVDVLGRAGRETQKFQVVDLPSLLQMSKASGDGHAASSSSSSSSSSSDDDDHGNDWRVKSLWDSSSDLDSDSSSSTSLNEEDEVPGRRTGDLSDDSELRQIVLVDCDRNSSFI